jgi:hypothetical protein
MVDPFGASWFYGWFYRAPLDAPRSSRVHWRLPPGTPGAEASGPAPPDKKSPTRRHERG